MLEGSNVPDFGGYVSKGVHFGQSAAIRQEMGGLGGDSEKFRGKKMKMT